MLNQKENIIKNILDAILVLLFLLFVLSLSNHNSYHSFNGNKHGTSCENIVSQSNAIINTNAPFTTNQKTWASEIKFPEFNNPGKNIISENRKTNDQISIQKESIAKTENVSIFIVHFHSFSKEKDDLPFLS